MSPVTRMTHHENSHGRATLVDPDLVQLCEQYEDLRPVLEELQYLRQEYDHLTESLGAVEAI